MISKSKLTKTSSSIKLKLSFVDWLNIGKRQKWIKKSDANIDYIVNKNNSGRCFISLYGNGTYNIRKELKNMGFKFFPPQKSWGKPIDKITEQDITFFQSIGLPPWDSMDTSPCEEETKKDAPIQSPVNTKEKTFVDKKLEDMKEGVKTTIEQASGNSSNKVKQILKHVDTMIEKLAEEVDSIASSEFVKSFLKFSSKFYNYSFGNQILIWVQKPDAKKVASANKWMQDFGRRVVNWENGIDIIAPRHTISQAGKEKRKQISNDEWDKVRNKYNIIYFVSGKVYDISDTEPIPNWKGKDGSSPFEMPSLKFNDSNETNEELENLIEAAIKWAKTENIDINYKDLDETLGGYSEGLKVTVNNKFLGVRRLSTLIHELSHEVLHQTKEGKELRKKEKWTRQEVEIDAESTAYIVLGYYNIETKDAPNYLALWRSSGEKIKGRKENIHKASKIIIEGINKSMKK